MINKIQKLKDIAVMSWTEVSIKDTKSLVNSLRDNNYSENSANNWECVDFCCTLPSFKAEMMDKAGQTIEIRHHNTFRTFIDKDDNIWDINWLEIQ